MKEIKVLQTGSAFEREPLIRPFGFKGGYLTELWQVASKLDAASGHGKIGIATQSVLYGDADLFATCSETEGNALMYKVVNEALELIKQTPFISPVHLLDTIFPELLKRAKKITRKTDLNLNFVYNALVSADNAAWLLYAAENGYQTFDEMIPQDYQKGLSHRNNKVAIMYQVPYGMPMQDLKDAAAAGYFVFKIKTGYPGSQAEMLQRDMERLTQVHETLKNLRTTQTESGKLIYTMDANGRYERKELLMRYLDHARKIGAFEHILFYEEPLTEQNDEDVGDMGLPMAADESVHDEVAALRRIEQGYGALVLKGIAKTLSLSMKIARLADEKNIPCLCADLTVNPILIDWNKNLAARLQPFPGVGMGFMETNGDMNYQNWKNMLGYHPLATASWTKPKNGVFELNEDYYARSGGIFEAAIHYSQMFNKS
uniref:mandelate racemase/muconate lactonizing enzyme family protein n=1 Tax=Pedobacter schmidteae TaxID=2201271 RepID=UPI000EB37FA0|nr:mandelate racemase/muconate lactonizing enzyme family protein [Pedobacter schmidteae]